MSTVEFCPMGKIAKLLLAPDRSEYITSGALKNSFPDFLAGSSPHCTFAKFIADRIDFYKNKGLDLAA